MPKKKKTREVQTPVQTERKITAINPFGAPSVYSNFAQVTMTQTEFGLRFSEVLKTSPDEMITRELINVVMPPPLAKAVHEILGRSIQKWEESHGQISAVEPAEPK